MTDTAPVDGMKEASAVIQAYTYPLLEFDERQQPALIASCLFLEIDQQVHLVTAAHALRGRSVGLMTRGPSHLFDIRAQGGMARGVNGEEFDIAVLDIDRETVVKQGIRKVPESMLASAVEVENPQARAICGFPISKNKPVNLLDRKTKTVTTQCLTYFGFANFAGDHKKFRKSSDIHLGLNYGSGTDDHGRTLTSPPSPRGSSGGGAWLIPDFRAPEQVFLEGIVIECHQNRFVFSTRIEHVVNFIRARKTLSSEAADRIGQPHASD